MFHARTVPRARVSVIALIGVFFGAQAAVAQSVEHGSTHAMYPLANVAAHATAQAVVPPSTPTSAAPRGPLARMQKNPDPSGGTPPFVLTDQAGTIQRYVEPVPGSDLEPYVGQVVIVRHDTGRTLLSSQLELPPQPLYPMLGESAVSSESAVVVGPSTSGRPSPSSGAMTVQQAQYADDDNATVELLDDGAATPKENEQLDKDGAPDGSAHHEGGYPVFPDDMLPAEMERMGIDAQNCCPEAMQAFPVETYGEMPCPNCHGSYRAPGYAMDAAYGQPFDPADWQPPRYFAEVELNMLRAHVVEDAVGKLSEKYEFSPRFIVGFTGIGPLNGRVRYWLYRRDTPTLGGDSLRLEFDVLDIEGTHYFAARRSEVVLAAGLRLGHIELIDGDNREAGGDLMGMTFAADGRTPLQSFDGGRIAWVYGGRLSILGGDWDGDNRFINRRIRDDNIVVHELYTGLEFMRRYRDVDFRARLAFELQNWHSDVLSESADFGTIGFIGPGLRVGAEF